MKISEKWLREWVSPLLSTEELVARLTMAGLEVDSVTPVAGKFSGVVVGEIISIAQHPDADKLRVCQVAGHSSGMLQVVCGAANARQGIKIPFALVGAELPAKEGESNSFVIKTAKLRGVESNGMLCSARELGIESTIDGLLELPVDAAVGTDIRKYLDLDDQVIEFGLTPNRGDCLSVRGLAREISALTGTTVSVPSINAVKPTIKDIFPVELEASAQCPCYVGRVIKNVDMSRSSPLWLQEKLRRSGIRTINPVVDVTNYVLLELGQPMHAFDLSKLSGKIKVKLSSDGEIISLLDGQKITLESDTLLISDNKPLAMAGIMGGSESAVLAETRDIFLESAYFDPLALAGKARSYGLHTDSSHRFERGVDFQLQEIAMERASGLLLAIAGGDAGPLIVKQERAQLPKVAHITLRFERIAKYLGLKLTPIEVQKLLEGLGIQVLESRVDSLLVQAPSWRFDIRLEVDLLEEIARVYGYNNLPTHSFHADLKLTAVSERHVPLDAVKSRLASLGYREVITYSFVDPTLQSQLKIGVEGVEIPVQNPISAEMGVMRTSLLPGLLSTALYNLNRQQNRVRVFESGLTFSSINGKTQQEPALGLLICGSRKPEGWFTKSSQLVDFYDIKGDIEALFALVDAPNLNFKPTSNPALHPGQSADIYSNDRLVGWVGVLHPSLQGAMGFNQPVFIAQVTLESLKYAVIPAFDEVSRFPEVRRDLAFIVGKEVPVQLLCEAAKSAADSYLINLKVFDVYSGEGIDPQRKSVAFGLTFQAKSRTLTDCEINENVDRVIETLGRRFQAELRS